MANKMKSSPARIAFVIFNDTILILFALLCLAPFLNLLAISFSSGAAASNGIGIIPMIGEKMYSAIFRTNLRPEQFMQL